MRASVPPCLNLSRDLQLTLHPLFFPPCPLLPFSLTPGLPPSSQQGVALPLAQPRFQHFQHQHVYSPNLSTSTSQSLLHENVKTNSSCFTEASLPLPSAALLFEEVGASEIAAPLSSACPLLCHSNFDYRFGSHPSHSSCS